MIREDRRSNELVLGSLCKELVLDESRCERSGKSLQMRTGSFGSTNQNCKPRKTKIPNSQQCLDFFTHQQTVSKIPNSHSLKTLKITKQQIKMKKNIDLSSDFI